MHQINIDDETMNKFIDLARRCGIEGFDDLNATFQYSLNLLTVAVEAIEDGKDIAVVDTRVGSIVYVKLPLAENIQKRLAECRPHLKVVE